MVGAALVPVCEYDTPHVAEALEPVNVQLAGLTVLVSILLVKSTVPDGVKVPGDTSFTVAVQTVCWPIATVEGEHANDVNVGKLEPHDSETPVGSPAATFVMMLSLAVRIPGPEGVHVT